jgi:uncharacterized protein YggT (Ycf19 family)
MDKTKRKTTKKPTTAPRLRRNDEFRETLAAPMPNSSYRSEIDLIDEAPSSLEQAVRTVAGFLILLLTIRFIVSFISLDRSGAWASLFYPLTNWAVSPFLPVFGQSSVIQTSGFVDWATLTAIFVTTITTWIVIKAIRPRA